MNNDNLTPKVMVMAFKEQLRNAVAGCLEVNNLDDAIWDFVCREKRDEIRKAELSTCYSVEFVNALSDHYESALELVVVKSGERSPRTERRPRRSFSDDEGNERGETLLPGMSALNAVLAQEAANDPLVTKLRARWGGGTLKQKQAWEEVAKWADLELYQTMGTRLELFAPAMRDGCLRLGAAMFQDLQKRLDEGLEKRREFEEAWMQLMSEPEWATVSAKWRKEADEAHVRTLDELDRLLKDLRTSQEMIPLEARNHPNPSSLDDSLSASWAVQILEGAREFILENPQEFGILGVVTVHYPELGWRVLPYFENIGALAELRMVETYLCAMFGWPPGDAVRWILSGWIPTSVNKPLESKLNQHGKYNALSRITMSIDIKVDADAVKKEYERVRSQVLKRYKPILEDRNTWLACWWGDPEIAELRTDEERLTMWNASKLVMDNGWSYEVTQLRKFRRDALETRKKILQLTRDARPTTNSEEAQGLFPAQAPSVDAACAAIGKWEMRHTERNSAISSNPV